MFYVYLHITLDDKTPFYVGKGNGKRAYVKSHRSRHWNNIVTKHGYEIVLLEENLTEEQSLIKEKEYIFKYGRRDLKTGTLVNFTDGGEGTVGRTVSNKTRAAVANANKLRIASELNRSKTSSLYKGKFGIDHNRSKKVICIETQKQFNSMSEAERFYNLGGGAVSWSVKHVKPIFGMHFEIKA